jgi:hypothetical protein
MNPERPFYAAEVIQTGLTKSRGSETKIRTCLPKGSYIIYCNMDRYPFVQCEGCADQKVCLSYLKRVIKP